jgi:hypothetical protein
MRPQRDRKLIAAFDRSWTLVSVLWLGLLVTLYAFDFWTA